VIKFVSDLWQVSGFLHVLRFSSTNKTGHHDITKILVKVALNTITLTLYFEATIYQYVRHAGFIRQSRENSGESKQFFFLIIWICLTCCMKIVSRQHCFYIHPTIEHVLHENSIIGYKQNYVS
jgi:hypothetical protein